VLRDLGDTSGTGLCNDDCNRGQSALVSMAVYFQNDFNAIWLKEWFGGDGGFVLLEVTVMVVLDDVLVALESVIHIKIHIVNNDCTSTPTFIFGLFACSFVRLFVFVC